MKLVCFNDKFNGVYHFPKKYHRRRLHVKRWVEKEEYNLFLLKVSFSRKQTLSMFRQKLHVHVYFLDFPFSRNEFLKKF